MNLAPALDQRSTDRLGVPFSTMNKYLFVNALVISVIVGCNYILHKGIVVTGLNAVSAIAWVFFLAMPVFVVAMWFLPSLYFFLCDLIGLFRPLFFIGLLILYGICLWLVGIFLGTAMLVPEFFPSISATFALLVFLVELYLFYIFCVNGFNSVKYRRLGEIADNWNSLLGCASMIQNQPKPAGLFEVLEVRAQGSIQSTVVIDPIVSKDVRSSVAKNIRTQQILGTGDFLVLAANGMLMAHISRDDYRTIKPYIGYRDVDESGVNEFQWFSVGARAFLSDVFSRPVKTHRDPWE